MRPDVSESLPLASPLPVALLAVSSSTSDLAAQVGALEDAIATAGGRRLVTTGKLMSTRGGAPGLRAMIDHFATLTTRGDLAEVWVVDPDIVGRDPEGRLPLRTLRPPRAQRLLERVSTGSLSRDRLRLAAYAGDVGARRALGRDAPAPFLLTRPEAGTNATARTGGQWARRLVSLGGREALARAVVAAVRAAKGHDLGRSVEVAEEWFAEPAATVVAHDSNALVRAAISIVASVVGEDRREVERAIRVAVIAWALGEPPSDDSLPRSRRRRRSP